jgi:PEP-CTERM motif-containing protein
MRKGVVLAATLCALTLAARVDASTITVATTNDPSLSSSTPLFTFAAASTVAGSTLDGSWLGTGMNLLFAPTGQTFSDVTFDFPTLTAIGLVPAITTQGGILFGAGSFSFFFNGAALLTYAWNSAVLNDSSLGSSDLFLQGVSITGSGALAGWTFANPQMFSFAFANATNTIGNALQGISGRTASWTASFTSSAGPPIPEPGSLILLGGGLVALAATVRRRKLRKR